VPIGNQVCKSSLFTQSGVFVVHKKAGAGYLFQVTLFKVGHSHESYGLPKSLGKALGATRYRSFWLLPGGGDLLGERANHGWGCSQ